MLHVTYLDIYKYHDVYIHFDINYKVYSFGYIFAYITRYCAVQIFAFFKKKCMHSDVQDWYDIRGHWDVFLVFAMLYVKISEERKKIIDVRQ